jgi:hypothetical protein
MNVEIGQNILFYGTSGSGVVTLPTFSTDVVFKTLQYAGAASTFASIQSTNAATTNWASAGQHPEVLAFVFGTGMPVIYCWIVVRAETQLYLGYSAGGNFAISYDYLS